MNCNRVVKYLGDRYDGIWKMSDYGIRFESDPPIESSWTRKEFDNMINISHNDLPHRGF